MKNSPENPKLPEVLFPELSLEIDQMTEVDQDLRERVQFDNKVVDDLIEADRQNTARMKETVSQIGWPTVSKVGKESSTHAWLLVQHADRDIEFQKYCLTLMKQEPSGEVDLHDIAYLEDRTKVWSKQLQIYGTQYKEIDGKFVPDPMEDPEGVDERRKSMNLPTLAENIEEMYKKYNVEKPK